MPSKAGNRQKSYEIDLIERKGQPLVRTESDIKRLQALFLECIALKAPEVLRVLQSNILPLYRSLPVWIRTRKRRGPKVPRNILARKVRFIKLPDVLLYKNLHFCERYPQAAALKEALERWATLYNLNADWLLDAALGTLYCWTDPENCTEKDPNGPALSFASHRNVTWHKDNRPPVEYQHPNWKTGQTWGDYERAQLAAFKEHLKRHAGKTLKDGYSLESPENTDHLSWVALAYGRRLNFRQIADLSPEERDGHIDMNRAKRSGGINTQAIQKAVQEKAHLISLPRLVMKRGRPPKSQPARSFR